MKGTRESGDRQRHQTSESLAQHLKTCDACWNGRLCEAGKKLKRGR